MKSLMLFINGQLGINVLKHVILDSDTLITAIVINKKHKRALDYQSQIIEVLSPVSERVVILESSEDLWKQANFMQALTKSNIGVSALFGHLIPEQVIRHFGGNLFNLHPSLLPYGRGADPIAWSIIEDNPVGVSLHQIDREIDSGEVISQIEIPYSFDNTSGDLYETAMQQLLKLFVQFYSSPHQFIPKHVAHKAGTFHRTSELNEIRATLLQGDPNLERNLRVIQALSFNNGSGARVKLRNGETWRVKINATREMDEENHG
jgi:methionyl-tRNA formyltransferase